MLSSPEQTSARKQYGFNCGTDRVWKTACSGERGSSCSSAEYVCNNTAQLVYVCPGRLLCLLQVNTQLHSSDKLSAEVYTAGCDMEVPADGMVFMLLLVVQFGQKSLYDLLTRYT